MQPRKLLLDAAYFLLLILLVSYGLLLVIRGYLGLALSGRRRSPTGSS